MFQTIPASPLVLEILANASRSAHLLSSGHINADHILHSILSQNGGIAIEILTEYRIDATRMMLHIQCSGRVCALPFDGTKLPMGVSGQEVLKRAIQNAESSGRTTVLTGDLLVGMLMDNRNPAAKILHRFGITESYLHDIQGEVTAKYEFNNEE